MYFMEFESVFCVASSNIDLMVAVSNEGGDRRDIDRLGTMLRYRLIYQQFNISFTDVHGHDIDKDEFDFFAVDHIYRHHVLLKGQTFTVYGEINSITDNDWCYIACPLCTKGLSEVDGKWFCPKDDIVDDPVYSYRLSTTITDGHESINATLFNDVVLQLIEVPCSTLVESSKEDNTTGIPHLIQDCIGKSTKFFIQAYKNERTNHIKCTVDRTIPITDSIRAKMQIPTPKAPKTPQQLQVIPVQHAPSTAKRQLQ
ncbi:hypothetical protein QVD17_37971 [Tagetes erecta]|uniref:Replication factor A C-terminal domain-containing protein n=1 Tax=Tagetes erecta TaxID=13708 RepID=A0AAD8NJP5_TARER|nr:hypothetical protein QVD17_37971 [Tagetes erecta]